MKKSGILNKDLNNLIGSIAHGDFIIVSDAGLAIPKDVWRIELAIERDVPEITRILELLKEELIVEKVCVTQEMKENNNPLYKDILDVYKDMPVVMETIPHEKLITELIYKAKAVIRTGSFTPYGNTILYTGIDAPKWFEREGLKVPEFYKDRVKK
jgi:D-ribose pyranose/furanose isomerase RbsD